MTKNSEALNFIDSFLAHRRINRDFFELVPEDKFDYRMVNTSERKSDSPRESIIHQTYVTWKYIDAVRTGVLKFDESTSSINISANNQTKSDLLSEFNNSTDELIKVCKEPGLANKKVSVSWSKSPISALSCLSELISHEALHTGWNLAVMDHLGINRFASLRSVWG